MWPTTFAWRGPLGEPPTWGKPGLVMLFNLECAACISRGIPMLKRFAAEYGDRLQPLLVHTTCGHRDLPPHQVLPALAHFAESFARLEIPIAIDPHEEMARAWGAEGTPHWLLYDARGELVRSIFGSQDNARTRLEYALQELMEGAEGDAPASDEPVGEQG